jgi:membrane protease YdiL (CAAX protease family)
MSDDSASTDATEPTASSVARGPATVTAGLSRMPRVTRLTVVGSLLALPGLVTLVDALGLTPGPLAKNALQWAVALAVLGVVVGVEDRPLASVGFRRPAWRDLAYLVGTAAVVMAVFIAGRPVVAATGLTTTEGASSLEPTAGIGVALLSAVTTGVVEEILYRGYPLERLLEHTDSAAVAGSLTVALFTVAHLVAWPVGNVVLVAAVSVVLTAVYLRRRTLVPVVGAHVGIWVLAVLGQYYG